MRLRALGIAGCIVLLAGAAWAIVACGAQAASCDVCQRDECTALSFRIEYADGGRQVTCCPRCASHAVAEAGSRRVSRLIARDFATGRDIDAREAVYVDGSDVEHCMARKEEPSEGACCRQLMYDRCLPSLIAFGSLHGAQAFSREHGGVLRRFDELSFGQP